MSQAGWDQEYDVVVVGSGAGGMTAALCAHAHGLSSVVIEKSDRYGGTSAVSGGGIWIPCNDDIAKTGGSDSYEQALTYLKHLIGDSVPQARIEAYLKNAPEMVRYLARTFDVHFHNVPKYPDYYPNVPGGKEGWRSMQPQAFDARLLGPEFDRQREPIPGTLLMGRIAMDQIEAHTLFSRGPGWVGLTLKLMLRYWLDFGWRRRTHRDRRQVLGQGLVAALRHAMLRRDIPLQLNTALSSLIEDGGRVIGLVVEQNGRTLRYRARHGVVLACGGFESNQQMRERYLTQPTQARWTAAPPINHGDGIRAAQALGARLGHMDWVWGSPTVYKPGAPPQVALFVERGMPGCVAVNKKGRRFVNEAAPYPDFRNAMYADDAKGNGTIPCWLVFDATFRYKYPMGIFLPGQIQPDHKLPKDWLDRIYYRADTLDALAAKIGVDAAGLKDTVAKMNAYAQTGVDPEFHKGDTAFDRYYSDPSVKPNSCLGPIVKPPFYAVPLWPGEIGTKGGLVTDEHARVLREDGSLIGGLYAVGNTADAVMGPTYAGAGSTLGPAMTFAYIAARDLAAQAAASGIRAAA
ncbi:3-oxosteroid 1-dehydrogenase [Fontimonas thermophila]|uniref:3-oxosteroid 1-dehydrogenase n=1 Tax=Fontimonas thermophila TaxID=1076937 RepID=A0A1I2KGQ5_9GAMM|nr:FAD-dependent oxidoreductase [Fontimonas thermophila]SFF64291.1 3-oxosteroid 1-dehydrogenase [Fontimonas thermophila]